MRTRHLFLALSSAALLSGCFTTGTSGPGDASSSSSSVPPVTRNVSYTGVVSALTVTGTSDATHQLTLDGGSSVLLVSSDVNLNLGAYVGEKVEVRGSAQPTPEGDTLLSVSEVTVLGEIQSSVASSSARKTCGGIAHIECDPGYECADDLSDDCDTASGGADCSGVCVPVSGIGESSSSSTVSSSSSSSVSSSSSKSSMSSKSSSSAPVVSSSSSSAAASSAKQKEIQLMAKQNYATPSLWTQLYCTSHIAFCVSAHKNWYFKSFGATTTTLWHVEFGMGELDELGQGVIMMNLVSGSSTDGGGVSGQVKTVGNDVVGYMDWKGDHFEISADASLKPAIQYMLTTIKAYTPAE